jgi:hypothetical protein
LTDLPSLYIDDSWFAQMVAVSLPVGTDRLALKEFFYHQYRIEVPLIEWHRSILLRISVQGYNLAQDIGALIMALTEWGST